MILQRLANSIRKQDGFTAAIEHARRGAGSFP
jgi:hypothetical protein